MGTGESQIIVESIKMRITMGGNHEAESSVGGELSWSVRNFVLRSYYYGRSS